MPQPSDAATASAGRSPRSASEYRLEVIGSLQPHDAGPQQLAVVDSDERLTAAAIAPYFSFVAC